MEFLRPWVFLVLAGFGETGDSRLRIALGVWGSLQDLLEQPAGSNLQFEHLAQPLCFVTL